MSEQALTTREAVAHHEAGHAIAYMAHGLSFRYITLRPVRSSGALGMVRQWHPKRRDGRTLSIIKLAGYTAELLYSLSISDPEDDWGYDPDIDGGWTAHDDLLCGVHLAMVEHKHLDEIAEADQVFPIEPLSAKIQKTIHLIDGAWSSVSALARACLDSPRAVTYPEALRAIGAESPEHAVSIIDGLCMAQVDAR